MPNASSARALDCPPSSGGLVTFFFVYILGGFSRKRDAQTLIDGGTLAVGPSEPLDTTVCRSD